MIKGVNRQVLEVSDTGCEYFERALYFVSPKYYGLGEAKLREKASKLSAAAARPPKTRASRIKKRVAAAASLTGAAALGAAAASLLSFIR